MLPRFALILLLLPALSSCRYNFVPLIPKTAQGDLRLPARITTAELTRQGDSLVLRAALVGTFEPGYLQVIWFNNSQRLAEDSVYVDNTQREVTFKYDAPDKGAYRATLSLGGDVLRQVELYEVKP